MAERKIVYEYISRVEGQGSLEVTLRENKTARARFEIFEAPRFFEALVKGRKAVELPEITTRVCGICPIAHSITATRAVENGLGIVVDDRTSAMRKVLALSGILQSHALHIYLLAAPDFLGYAGFMKPAKDLRETILTGLRLKRIANRISEWVGGRAVHPVTVVVGGFSRSPPREDADQIMESLDLAFKDAIKTIELVTSFKYPDFEPEHEFVCVSGKNGYPINEGLIHSSSGLHFDESSYQQYIVEEQVPYSNTKRSRLKNGGSFEVGPVSRFNLNYDLLGDAAKEAAEHAGIESSVKNPFKSTIVRSIEALQAIDEMRNLIREGFAVPPPTRFTIAPGRGSAVTEAPRGLLYHSYNLNMEGKVASADIVTPTANNSYRLEEDVAELAPSVAHLSDQELVKLFGMLVRAYDPCISCSVHELHVRVKRDRQKE